MKFQIEYKLNDGLAEAPTVEIEVKSVGKLLDHIYGEELTNDDGQTGFQFGGVLTIERTA